MDSARADVVDVGMRAAQVASDLEADRDKPDALALHLSDVVETLRAAAAALAQVELDRMLLEAKDEQIARQAEMLEAVGHPLLQVRIGVLCAPVIGPIDYERARRLMEVALTGAVARSARHMVIDLTGAVVADPDVVRCLADVARALSLVGVRVALSGIRADIARLLAEGSDALAGISTYPTLAGALEAIRDQKVVRR